MKGKLLQLKALKRMIRIFLKVSFVILILVYIYLIFNPIVSDKYIKTAEINYYKSNNKGDIFKPFNDFKFDIGHWKVCLIVRERYEISSDIPYGSFLYTEDLSVIAKFKNLDFTYTGADVATVENEILFYNDDKVVFRARIVLDEKRQGLQKETFGWIKGRNGELLLIIKDFKLNYFPVIYL